MPDWTPIRRACNPAKLWCKVDAEHGRLQFKDGTDYEVIELSSAGVPVWSAGDSVTASIPGVGVFELRVTGVDNDGVIRMEREPQEG